MTLLLQQLGDTFLAAAKLHCPFYEIADTSCHPLACCFADLLTLMNLWNVHS